MRERLLTPFFPLPDGDGVGTITPARELLGRTVCNGRFLLRGKSGHSRTTVRYHAHDLVSGLEVDLDLHPDAGEDAGYRLGRSAPPQNVHDLPDLYDAELGTERPHGPPRESFASCLKRLLRTLTPSR